MPESSGTLSARTDKPGISPSVAGGDTLHSVSALVQPTTAQVTVPSIFSRSAHHVFVFSVEPHGTQEHVPRHYLNKQRTCTAMVISGPIPLPSTASMNATRQEEHARFRLSLHERRPIQWTGREAVDFLLGRTYPRAKMRIPFLPTSGPHIPWIIAERQTQ